MKSAISHDFDSPSHISRRTSHFFPRSLRSKYTCFITVLKIEIMSHFNNYSKNRKAFIKGMGIFLSVFVLVCQTSFAQENDLPSIESHVQPTADPSNMNYSVITAVCYAEDFTFPDGSVQTISRQTIQTSALQAINGCDSIITTTVNIHPFYDETKDITIYEGDTFLFGTQTLTKAGLYSEVFESSTGCDSIIELNLFVTTVATEVTDAGINQNSLNMSVVIYPNPNNGKFYVELNGANSEEYTVELFNSLGQVIYASQMEMNNSHLVELQETLPGVYVVRVGNENTETHKRIIIQ